MANSNISQSLTLQVADGSSPVSLPNFTRAVGPVVFPASALVVRDYFNMTANGASFLTADLQGTPFGVFYMRNISSTPIQFSFSYNPGLVVIQVILPGNGIYYMGTSDTKAGFGTIATAVNFTAVATTIFPVTVEIVVAIV